MDREDQMEEEMTRNRTNEVMISIKISSRFVTMIWTCMDSSINALYINEWACAGLDNVN